MPLTITNRGYYFFVEDITTTGNAILIDASEVTIDLVGHTLSGTGGYGIKSMPGRNRISVLDGHLSGWFVAVSLGGEPLLGPGTVREWVGTLTGSQCLVKHIRVDGVSWVGMALPDSSAIRNSSVALSAGNAQYAMICGDRCEVSDSSAFSVGLRGLAVGDNSTITRSSIAGRYYGLVAGNGVHIRDSSIDAIDETGASVGPNAVIERSSFLGPYRALTLGNGGRVKSSTIRSYQGAPFNVEFNVGSDCVIEDTLLTGMNIGMKITGTGNRIEGNIIRDNFVKGLEVAGAGNVVVRNYAYSNPINYEIAPGNISGPISTSSAMTSPIGNIGE